MWTLRSARLPRLALLVLLATSLGCAQVSQYLPGSTPTDLTPAEKQMAEDDARFNETVLGGILVGATVGGIASYVLCKITGGGPRKCNAFLAVGVLAGGTAGGVDGYNKAKVADQSNKKMRKNELILADLQRDNSNLERSVASSGTVIAESTKRIQNQKVAVAKGRKTREQAEADLARAQRNRDAVEDQVEKAKASLAVYKEARDPADRSNSAQLNEQIKTMEKQIATLEKYIASIDDSMKVNRV